MPVLRKSISAPVLPLCVFVTRYGDTVTFCGEISISQYVIEVRWESVGWIDLVRVMNKYRAVVNTVMNPRLP